MGIGLAGVFVEAVGDDLDPRRALVFGHLADVDRRIVQELGILALDVTNEDVLPAVWTVAA